MNLYFSIWIGRYYLILIIARYHLYPYVFGSCEKESLSYRRIEEDVFFLLGKFKHILQDIDGGTRLFEEELYRRVGNYRFSKWTCDKIFYILSDGCHSQIILSCSFHESKKKFC